jgi:L-idonate 5-dehydrogenase
LHAVQRAGALLGRRVLIAGAGTIGALIAAAAKAAGAREIVVSDLSPRRREVAHAMGATRVFDPVAEADEMRQWDEAGGVFDLGFEATGSHKALPGIIRSIRRGGKAILVGMLPSATCELPFHHMSTREIDLVSTFRQNNVFGQAVDMLVAGAVDPLPILTSAYGLDAAHNAFEASLDREANIKVIFVSQGDTHGILTGHALHH